VLEEKEEEEKEEDKKKKKNRRIRNLLCKVSRVASFLQVTETTFKTYRDACILRIKRLLTKIYLP
jgi:hypothetical protein